MTRPEASRPSPRFGSHATWVLGVVGLLALGAWMPSILARLDEPDDRPPPLVLGPPGEVVTVRRADAVRLDTFPEILSVATAVEGDDGWVILDGRARRVHVVSDVPGEAVRSFGREGEGPGEMTFPLSMAVAGSRIGVVEGAGDRVVRFTRSGSTLGPVRLEDNGCAFGPSRTILAAAGGGFLVLRNCTGMDGSSRALLLGIEPDGTVHPVHERRLRSLRGGAVDPFATPVAAMVDGVPYLGILSEGCLERVGRTPNRPDARPLCAATAPPVPLPDSLRADLEALGRRLQHVGGTVEIPDMLPPFTEVRTTSAGLVLEVPLSAERDVLDLVEDGSTRVRFDVEAPAATFVGRRHVLLARDLLNGTELAWVARN